MIAYLGYDSSSSSFDPGTGLQVGYLRAIPVSGRIDGRPADSIRADCLPWRNFIAFLLAVAATVGGLGFLDRTRCS